MAKCVGPFDRVKYTLATRIDTRFVFYRSCTKYIGYDQIIRKVRFVYGLLFIRWCFQTVLSLLCRNDYDLQMASFIISDSSFHDLFGITIYSERPNDESGFPMAAAYLASICPSCFNK